MKIESSKTDSDRLYSGYAGAMRYLILFLFAITFLAAAAMTLPFSYVVPNVGLDYSHIFGSNYFPFNGFRYGSDLIFTYGPLGYLVNPENVGSHVLIANVLRAAIWLMMLGHFVLFFRLDRTRAWKSFLLMGAIILAHNQLSFSFDYFILATMMIVVLYMVEMPGHWIGALCVIFISGILGVTKFTAYVLSIPPMVLFLAMRCGYPIRLPRRREGSLLVAVLFAGPILFMFHNPSLSGFRNYIYGSLQLASGYSEAMSTATPSSDIFYAGSLSALFLLGLVYGVFKRALPWTAAAVLALIYWINFKHGFVRTDGHTVFAFSFEIILAAVLICLLKYERRLTVKYLVAFAAFAMLALFAIDVKWPVWNGAYWSFAAGRQTISDLLNWKETEVRIDEQKARNDPFLKLPPQFRASLEGSAAAVFPWELSYAMTGHFRLEPFYVMQEYSAYTAYLDRKTAERIRTHRDGAPYVLFEWASIDGRHPLLDVPETWRALAENYEPEAVAPEKMLLKKRSSPISHTTVPIKTAGLPFGVWFDLPQAKSMLWATIHVPYSGVGWLRRTLYKADALYIGVTTANGDTARFRVIPGVLSSPFPITATPINFDGLALLWQEGKVESPIVRVRLETNRPGDYGEPSIDLSEERDSGIQILETERVSVRSKFGVASSSEITKTIVGNIDAFNRMGLPAFPDEQHPFTVRAEEGVTFDGWFATDSKGTAFDELYAIVNDRVIRVSRRTRQDVADYFRNPALTWCGFAARLGEGDLRKGIQRVEFIAELKNDNSFYRFPNTVYLDVR